MSVATEELVSLETIREAAARIVGIAVKTPLVRAPFPGVAGDVWLKAESMLSSRERNVTTGTLIPQGSSQRQEGHPFRRES